MWILLRKEILAHLLTFRLSAALVFTVILVAITTFIGSLDFSQRMQSYHQEYRQIRQDLDQATIYAELAPNIIVRPKVLSIFGRGIDRSIGSILYIGIGYIPTSPSWNYGSSDTHLMKALVPVDFATVVAILLSFLAVALGFDGLCGERESGTLKQLLAHGVARNHIVLAKLAAGALVLTLSLAVSFVLALLILMANPDISFRLDDGLRLALFFLLSTLFLTQIFAFSLMVSACTRTASTSLIVCLFAWLVGSVVYINALPSFARHAVEEEPLETFRARDRILWAEYQRQRTDWEAQHPGPGPAYLKGLEHGDRLRYAHPKGYAWLQQRNAFIIEKDLERADKRYRALWAHQEEFAQQAYLVDDWSILSPFTNYRTLIYQLARTTIDDKFHLVGLAHRYREAFIQYLRGRQAFSSRRWFSDDPDDQAPMIPDPEAVTAEMLLSDSPFMQECTAWAQAQEKKAQDDARRSLDLEGLPQFDEADDRSLGQSLETMTPGLAVLVLTFGLSVLITFQRFQRYDPT